MGGVVKTENRLLFTKKHNMKGVLKNCKDVPCKITTFKETNANDIGCAKVKVAFCMGGPNKIANFHLNTKKQKS